MKGYEALVFFHGVFWAAMINASARYQPFDTASAWHGVRRARWRFIVSFIILNLFPIGGFIIFSKIIPPYMDSVSSFISIAFGALSVFGFIRILHAVIASDSTYKRYYIDEEIKNVRKKGPCLQPQTFKTHLYPGLMYLFICYVIAYLMAKI